MRFWPGSSVSRRRGGCHPPKGAGEWRGGRCGQGRVGVGGERLSDGGRNRPGLGGDGNAGCDTGGEGRQQPDAVSRREGRPPDLTRFEAYPGMVFGFSGLINALPEGRQFAQNARKKVCEAVFLGDAMRIPSLLRIEEECRERALAKHIGGISGDTLGCALQSPSPEPVFAPGCEIARCCDACMEQEVQHRADGEMRAEIQNYAPQGAATTRWFAWVTRGFDHHGSTQGCRSRAPWRQ